MGALLGLVLGIGLFLMWRSGGRRPLPVTSRRAGWSQRTAESLAQAGIETLSPNQLLVASAIAAILAFVIVAVASGAPTIAAAFACFSASGPISLVRWRARQRTAELRELWPEAVDNLVSAVRAGLSLPEALSQLGEKGPQPLRRPFERFGVDYRATGRFGECLDRLKAYLADPVGDRLVESLRMARDVGGGDLGKLLRTLSAFLREEARARAELETRQGWTVNAARLAVAAPWLLLGMLCVHRETVQAYNSTAGAVVLAAGGLVSVLAYRAMRRIARLPVEERVLR